MKRKAFPIIDPVATGENIARLRKERGMTVRDLQRFFGFEDPQSVYKWQKGKTLPSVDHLYALSALLEVPMDEILVAANQQPGMILLELQAMLCRSGFLFWLFQTAKVLQPRPLSRVLPG